MNASEIRKSFLDFFESKQHTIVPSSPIVVKDDPTLMFTNAGMNQFKDVFLGNTAAKAPRIADTQKCLRVSGKHNDLEEVGYDTYHHTMFEMLGNWSFGDYFKKEAIEWAWEYLSEVVKIDKTRMYITVFGGDEADGLAADMEAHAFWRQFVAEDRILYGSKKDNFWEMGDSGPCGPCSEIHVDIRDDKEREAIDGKSLVNADHPEVIEIWNLVFIEFNRLANGNLVKLPAQHVDTGMGFERLTMVLQGKKSNYDTDIFQPLIQQISRLSGIPYGEKKQADIAMRVIADHLRAVSFAIADGQLPSNNGAGYVIRRILRRAVRYGFTFLSFEEPFVYKLLPTLAQQMGNSFPEIISQQELVAKVIFEEENSFLRTLSQGIRRFEHFVAHLETGSMIKGDFAFELFDTFGFPIDLTRIMAKEKGLTVDMKGFSDQLEAQKNRSRKAAEVAAGDWVVIRPDVVSTEFVGYNQLKSAASIVRFREVVSKKKKHYEIVLDVTPFYAESGGQVGDTGVLTSENETLTVFNTLKENNLIIHLSEQLPEDPTCVFTARVDIEKRLQTANNHSATHLMHAALRSVAGTHVEQKGSYVDHEKLRFDFSHFSKLTKEELLKVERIVNEKIRENINNETITNVPIEDAKAMGAMALFGEKYGETVRVITFDPKYSVELCGGTHVQQTGQIGLFKIVTEGAIAAGIRRIEAVTGSVAEKFVQEQMDQLSLVKELLKSTGNVVKSLQNTLDQSSTLQKQVEQLLLEKAATIAQSLVANVKTKYNHSIISEVLDVDSELLKNICSQFNVANNQSIIILGSINDQKPALCLLIPEKLVENHQLDAAKIIREAAKDIQGGGGGQKHFATAGGRDIKGLQGSLQKIEEALLAQIQ